MPETHEPDREPQADAPRRLSAPLLLAVIAAPTLFWWLLLRKGYSNTIRLGGFLLAAYSVAVAYALQHSA